MNVGEHSKPEPDTFKYHAHYLGVARGFKKDSNHYWPSVSKQQIPVDVSVPPAMCHSAFCCCCCCCVCSQARVTSGCFLPLTVYWLLTQMDYFINIWQLMYSHTNSKRLFPPHFAQKHPKFLRKLEGFFCLLFFLFFFFGFLLMSIFGAVWTERASPHMIQQLCFQVDTQKN